MAALTGLAVDQPKRDAVAASAGMVALPKEKVLLELFVMSKCPDASYCEHYLQETVEKLSDIVHVRTEYIMQVDNKGGITCKHGDEECAGNLVQLCVGRHTPPDHNFDWFYRFLTCSWDSGLPVSSPELVTTCLDKVGASDAARTAVQRCIAGPQGRGLLYASAAVVARRGVVHSCTVAVDKRQRCVRDGGEWYDCPGGSDVADFERSICDAYKKRTGKDADACGEQRREGEEKQPRTA
ncbi:hypothetical protein MNEG_9504 [Monoraphidium neglectum]|uniref:Gamma-interferon-inducible lysosomal thiol reductase n=1 Tax=Monoraphidium neglectum TaxID=145388 RepID=A0A0D2M4H7_9CHLO|nr:hypothetical protein MNEG_9504 [Monoraphidium neglectum]KIY98459.1 hypothetical protein MNEG_9504 [Monoraphidium neglectum]|eukprot:XP_013897479.1 hypothetical protein MNEG_9504 [Monoraphidium neglectum]